MVKIISWNIARRDEAWRFLLDTDADIALVQEATKPPDDVAQRLDIDPAPWRTVGAGLSRPWRAAVVKLSNRVGLQWLESKSVEDAHRGELAVSRLGTLAAAILTPSTGEPFIVASMYAPWEKPHSTTGSGWIYADGSVHRVISDLSALIGQQVGHRLLVAGDLNILHGYGENGSTYWASRYATAFGRMSALGLSFMGPQAPAGRRADPWPDELPRSSNNIPTYYTSHQSPATATRQLDFVFASDGLGECVRVTALNEPEHWGPSDHCRVEIEVA
ncbi:MAG: endonuclease/exonuclease/phosphatase family protein [Planctomycetota bacterium]|jgi:exonuclease III